LFLDLGLRGSGHLASFAQGPLTLSLAAVRIQDAHRGCEVACQFEDLDHYSREMNLFLT
jgi:hypothetical protein